MSEMDGMVEALTEAIEDVSDIVEDVSEVIEDVSEAVQDMRDLWGDIQNLVSSIWKSSVGEQMENVFIFLDEALKDSPWLVFCLLVLFLHLLLPQRLHFQFSFLIFGIHISFKASRGGEAED